MTGDEHFEAAEKYLDLAKEVSDKTTGNLLPKGYLDNILTAAQIHATLAQAAYTKKVSNGTSHPHTIA